MRRVNKLKILKSKISLSDILCAAILLLSALISGLLNLFTYGFDATELLSISFWMVIFIRLLASGLVLFTSAINKINHLEREDEKILFLERVLELSIKNDIGENFVEFLAEVNKEEKIKTYKIKINRKILKLDKHASHKNLNRWKNYQEDKSITSKNIDSHQYGRYVFKRQKLLNKLDNDYIEKNIDMIKIKYNYITRNMIVSDLRTKDDVKYQIVDKNKKMTKDLMPRFLYTLTFTVAMSSIVLDSNIQNLNSIFWINLATNIFTLIFSYFTGSGYGKTFAETVIVSNLHTKLQVINDYKIWKNRGV